jgi:hypothetical protein
MIRSLWNGLWGAIGAAVVCQVPEFLQQYTQRLGGHLDEARRMLGTAPQLAPRVGELEAAYNALLNSAGVGRVWAAATHFLTDVASGTLSIYRPAVPLGVEGLLYALIGVALGVLIGGVLALPFRRRERRR